MKTVKGLTSKHCTENSLTLHGEFAYTARRIRLWSQDACFCSYEARLNHLITKGCIIIINNRKSLSQRDGTKATVPTPNPSPRGGGKAPSQPPPLGEGLGVSKLGKAWEVVLIFHLFLRCRCLRETLRNSHRMKQKRQKELFSSALFGCKCKKMYFCAETKTIIYSTRCNL